MQSKIEQVKAKVAEVIALGELLFNTKLPPVQIKFDACGSTAGTASRRMGQYIVRFNPVMMDNGGWDHILNDTVPHELAHIFCMANPMLGRNHDRGWKRVAQMLGSTGNRCHNEQIIYAKGDTYEYITTSGKRQNVSGTIHSRIQAGRGRKVREDGSAINNQCQYRLVAVSGRPVNGTPITPPVTNRPSWAPVRKVPADDRMINSVLVNHVEPTQVVNDPTPAVMQVTGVTNAQKVRSRIGIAKQRGESPEVVIAWAVATLGQSKGLAKKYVSDNWPKVTGY